MSRLIALIIVCIALPISCNADEHGFGAMLGNVFFENPTGITLDGSLVGVEWAILPDNNDNMDIFVGFAFYEAKQYCACTSPPEIKGSMLTSGANYYYRNFFTYMGMSFLFSKSDQLIVDRFSSTDVDMSFDFGVGIALSDYLNVNIKYIQPMGQELIENGARVGLDVVIF